MSIGILVLLFAIQRYGTKFVGVVFAPVVTLWLVANFAVGLYNIIVHHPAILKALGPNYLFMYLVRNGRAGWESLGSVLFCVTGALGCLLCIMRFTNFMEYSQSPCESSTG